MPRRQRTLPTRALFRMLAVLSALALVGLGASTATAKPGPGATTTHRTLSQRIASVNAQLSRLSRQSDQLDEQYNVAAASATAANKAATRAQQAADRAAANYRAAHGRFVAALTAQYEGGGSSTAGQLLSSGSPQQYLDSLSLSSYLTNQFAATVKSQQVARVAAARARQVAGSALSAAKAKVADLATRRAALKQQSRRFQQVLGSLTAQQQQAFAHAQALAAAKARAVLANDPQPTSHAPKAGHRHTPKILTGPVSSTVQRVIAFAEAQVGKSYGYGASGPYSYDCSGLTMASWAQVGVHLPHSAADQYNYGRHVSYSDLQPGDLIFLYSPIGHVELYVGHDLAVSAADEAIGIVYVHPSDDMSDYVGATRLTG